VKWDVKRLQQQVASNEEELKELKVHIKDLKQNVKRLAG
jgi:cell division protein FtsB